LIKNSNNKVNQSINKRWIISKIKQLIIKYVNPAFATAKDGGGGSTEKPSSKIELLADSHMPVMIFLCLPWRFNTLLQADKRHLFNANVKSSYII